MDVSLPVGFSATQTQMQSFSPPPPALKGCSWQMPCSKTANPAPTCLSFVSRWLDYLAFKQTRFKRKRVNMGRETTHLKDICGFKYFVQLSDQESQFGLETTGVVNTVSEKPKNLQEGED